jgi:hypothetical protein
MMLFGSKNDTACPYCYKALDLKKVAFRCAGRGAPGRPACQSATDPKRLREFQDSTPVMPAITHRDAAGAQDRDELGDPLDVLSRDTVTCTSCGGESGVRMCPACHSTLPRSFDEDSPMIGLVGVRRSGKTVLLSVLHKELIRNVARRFNASIDSPGGSTGFARDLDVFEANMSGQGGALPQQTDAGAQKKAPAIYEWKYAHKGKTRATILSFYDSAGEDLVSLDTVMSQQYLKPSKGIILLLDPFAFPENLSRGSEIGALDPDVAPPEVVLRNLTDVLNAAHGTRKNKKNKTPIAVVVSKIDAFFDQVPANHPLRQTGSQDGAFDETESRTIHDHMAAMVANWGGDGLLRKLEQEFETYRLFGVSALGAEPDYRTATVNSRGLLPHRVADPLLWLMAERDFIPTRRN